MIKRISLFRLQRRSPEDIQKVTGAIASTTGKVPSLLDIEVGVNFSDDAGAFDVVLTASFKDIEALRVFEQDPYHASVKKTVFGLKDNSVERVVVDYAHKTV